MTPAERNTRLRQAADWVRNDGILAPDGKPLGFNMGEWNREAELARDQRPMTADKCGTVACIAGTIHIANALNGRFDVAAAKWLDLDGPQAKQLFEPVFKWSEDGALHLGLTCRSWEPTEVRLSSISPELAARVLEDMADRSSTEADWAGVAQRMIQEQGAQP